MTRFHPVVFGNYTLLERIAVDAAGEMFRARPAGNPEGEGTMLLKKFPAHSGADESSFQRLQHIAEISSSLHHENLLNVQDVGFIEGVFYIAAEYPSGRPLQEVMHASKVQRRPLEPVHVIHIVMSLCKGLHYVHTHQKAQQIPKGAIHAAICPENIWITFSGRVKIASLGMDHAQSVNKGPSQGMFERKFAYMSPEQADGRPTDCRSDIFALGTLLYEMATGEPLFRGGVQQVFSDLRQARFLPPEKVNPDLPGSLCLVIQKALRRDPMDRYATPEQMLTALEDVASDMPSAPCDADLAGLMGTLFHQGKPKIPTSPEAVRADSARQDRAPEKKPKQQPVEPAGSQAPKRFDPPPSDIRPDIPQPDRPPNRTPVPLPTKSAGGLPGKLTQKTTLLIGAGLLGLVLIAGVAAWLIKKPATTTTAEIQVKTALNALKNKQFDQAVLLFDQAVAAEPAMLKRLSKPYAEALEGQAAEYTTTDLNRAKELLETALKFDPKRLSSLSQLGLLHLRCNEYDQAARYYERAARLDAHHPDVFFNLGYIYALSEDFPKAEKMYSRVVALNPPFRDEALFNLAVVQERMGKRQECIRNLESALKANPNNKPARQYLKRLRG